MNCPRCSEDVEAGALYCGNCGFHMPAAESNQASVPLPPSSSVPLPPSSEGQVPLSVQPDAGQPPLPPIPSYAVVNPVKQKAEGRTTLGLVLSVLSVPGAIIPFIGGALAVCGLVISTSSRGALAKKSMSNLAVAFAALGLIASVGSYVYNINQYNDRQTAGDNSITQMTKERGDDVVSTTKVLDTPCYRTSVPAVANASSPGEGCSSQAYNAATLDASTNAYNLQAVTQANLTAENLATAGKEVAGSYLTSSLPGFSVTSQQSGTFAGSPAYYINAKNAQSVTVEMAIVVRKVAHGENVFVLVHAVNGQADLSVIEQSWEWK
jgi:hypothetical protein